MPERYNCIQGSTKNATNYVKYRAKEEKGWKALPAEWQGGTGSGLRSKRIVKKGVKNDIEKQHQIQAGQQEWAHQGRENSATQANLL